LNELIKSPLKRYDIECPSPQPGQKPNPSALNGHKELCSQVGSINASNTIAVIQIIASRLKRINRNIFAIIIITDYASITNVRIMN